MFMADLSSESDACREAVESSAVLNGYERTPEVLAQMEAVVETINARCLYRRADLFRDAEGHIAVIITGNEDI